MSLGQFKLFIYFFTKRFHKYKEAQNRLQRTKIKNVYKKHLSSNINDVIKTISFRQFSLLTNFV